MTFAENSMLTTINYPPVNASGEYCFGIDVSEDVRVESVEIFILSLYLDDVFQDTFSLTIIDDDCKYIIANSDVSYAVKT